MSVSGRTLLAALVALAGSLVFLGTPAAQASGYTSIGDQIMTQDTVWTAEGGPYQIDGRVQVASGVTLTIAPGAEVWVNKPIEIVGGLKAVGTADAPVSLHLNAGLLRGIGAYTDASRVVEIRHADITGPGPLIATSSDVYLGLTLTDSRVTGLGSTYFWYLTSLIVERNTFDHVGTLEVGSNQTTVSFAYNRFRAGPTAAGYNGYAQLVSWAAYGQLMQVHNNVFEATTRPRTLAISIDGRIDASGNYFGTTDVAQVKQWVRDQEDDLNLKTVVNVEPLLSAVPDGVPALEPGAVAAPTATRGDQAATVSWAAPVEDGGSPVTSYTVTSSPGGLTRTVAGDQTSTELTGLTNGTSYTFTVTATNAVGTSASSPASNTVTPAGLPFAPAWVTAGPGDSSASVSWWPADANGSPVTGYTVTSSPGGLTTTVAGDATGATIAGLANATSYKFTVTATNAVGTGPASAASNTVTPAAVPAAPAAVNATRGDRSATVSWIAPIDDGGSPVTSYTVTSSPGGLTRTVGGSQNGTEVTGLSNGTAYTFTVTATNAAGSSAASPASNTVIPAGLPSAASGVTAAPDDGSASVSWSPAGANGSPVTGYTVTSSPGGLTRTVAGNVTTATFQGLSNGTAYTFTVTATNALGTGPASAASNAATPAGLPNAMGAPRVVVRGARAIVTWAAANPNGAPTLGYRVDISKGRDRAVAGSARKVVFRSLPAGRYRVRVTARNLVGTGPYGPWVKFRIR